MTITHAVWEKRNLDVDTYEIILEENDSFDDFLNKEHALVENGAGYIVVKTPVGSPQFLTGLAQKGYCFVEAAFDVSLNKNDYRNIAFLERYEKDTNVYKVNAEDEQCRVYSEIEKGVFSTDRISIDPHFTKRQAALRFANWTRDMVARGDELYEISFKEQPFAFFTMHKEDNNVIRPTLMGTYVDFLNKGLGMLVQKKCLDTAFAGGAHKIKSVIVSNNPKVVRTNLIFGIIIDDISYTYTKHY